METVSVSVFDEPERKLCVSLELAFFFFFLFVYFNFGFLGNQAAASVFPTLNF